MFGPGESSVVVECTANSTCTLIHAILTSGLLFIILLTGFAYTTWLERRFLAAIQARIGPNHQVDF
jgi:NADH:ubiquinone oxidoreductase subunit H